MRQQMSERELAHRLLRAAAWVAGLLAAGVVTYFLVGWLTGGAL